MKKIFVVPEEKVNISGAIVLTVLKAIPKCWREVRGLLRAPTHLIGSETIAETTAMIFFDGMQLEGMGLEKPDLPGILVQGKKPMFVQFGKGAFGYCDSMPLDQSMLIIDHFIRQGYHGQVTFRWHNRDNRDMQCSCAVSVPEERKGAPTIIIEQNREDSDALEISVKPIVDICSDLGLQEAIE